MTLSKRVQFAESDRIEYTHSAIEYDRSPFVEASSQLAEIRAQLFKLPAIVFNLPAPVVVVEEKNSKKEKKRLKINTTMSHGPLFFTGLSTNYHAGSREGKF